MERKFLGAKVPRHFCSRERKFPGAKVPGSESSIIQFQRPVHRNRLVVYYLTASSASRDHTHTVV